MLCNEGVEEIAEKHMLRLTLFGSHAEKPLKCGKRYYAIDTNLVSLKLYPPMKHTHLYTGLTLALIACSGEEVILDNQ